MALILPLVLGVIGFFILVIWLDHSLNQNDDATTVGQFKKFQDSFTKGDK